MGSGHYDLQQVLTNSIKREWRGSNKVRGASKIICKTKLESKQLDSPRATKATLGSNSC